eukprot:1180856-Prorocentrum_minimum.AAC.2
MAKSVWSQVVHTYFFVVQWMSISMAVIMYNKWILAYSGFPYPLALTMWHMFFCSTVAFLLVRVLKVVKSVNMSGTDYRRRVMPIGLLYAASLWLSNSAYIHLSVSFIQMTKALMPGLVYMIGVFMSTERYSLRITLNMLVIAFGVAIAAYGEVNFVVIGVVEQLSSLGFEAVRLMLVQVTFEPYVPCSGGCRVDQLAGFDDESHPEPLLCITGVLHVFEHPVCIPRAAVAEGGAALGSESVGAGGKCVHGIRPEFGGVFVDRKDLGPDHEYRRGYQGLAFDLDVRERVRRAHHTVEPGGLLLSILGGVLLQPHKVAANKAPIKGSDQEREE